MDLKSSLLRLFADYPNIDLHAMGFPSVALKGQKLLAQGNALGYHVRKPVALKGQKLLARAKGHKQHALKGQKLLAQGNALGYHVRKLVAL